MDFVNKQDEAYFELLRLAAVTDQRIYSKNMLQQAISVLNQLPNYLSSQKRIIALLLSKAKKLNIFSQLTPEVQQLLTLKGKQAVITELAKTNQLNSIIQHFATQNIPMILLKGSAFSGVLYSKESPRISSDIDILVKTQHWQKAQQCLQSFMQPQAKIIDGVLGNLYEVTFKPSTKSGAFVDLHQSLVNPILFNIDENALWENSQQHPLFGQKNVRLLMPEHALIHQAIHAYKDMNFCKYNLIDSTEIISQAKPNIENTLAIAKQWGASVPLFILLKNCSTLMGCNINKGLLTQSKPNALTCSIINTLLKSRFTQPINNKKPFRYRVNQIAGQFMFTGSIIKPLALQWLFLKSVFSQSRQVETK